MADLYESKRLREERQPLAVKIKALNDAVQKEDRDFTAEEQGEWDKLNAAYDAYAPKIARAERAERAEFVTSDKPEDRTVPAGREDTKPGHTEDDDEPEERGNPKVTEEHRSLALQAWTFRQTGRDGDFTDRHQEACRLTGVNPNSTWLNLDLRRDYRTVRRENRAQSLAIDNLGGYSIPEGFVNNLERALLAFGGVREVATIRRTTTGEDLHWPTVNDTANKGRILNENTTETELTVPFGEIVLRAFNYSSRLVQVPVALLTDSAFDLASELGSLLGERIGRIQADHFTTGIGANQPYGIVVQSPTGKTAASATAIVGDELYDLLHSVDPAYRTGPGVGWMMHDNILLAVRKLKDGNGQYLWAPGLAMGQPDRILGYPVTVNQSMQSTVATATKTILFGQLSKYVIRDVGQVRMRRLVERYADADQEGFICFMRSDGNLLDAGGRPVKALTQA